MKRQLITIVRICFWGAIGVVLFFSLLPAEHLPSIAFDIWDKTQHALGFVTLGVLGVWAYKQAPKPVLLGLIVYGAVIELLQSLTGWRNGDWLDWLADTIGVAMAYLLVRLWKRSINRKENRGTVSP